ncbi:MAG: haloacid dehalogenase type II [Rhodospirillales bacterium]
MTDKHRLGEISACVFDAYGTLLDFSSAVRRSRAAKLPKANELIQLWRLKQLEYTWLRSLMGRFADFWHVTGDSLDYAMESLGIGDPALRAELMQLFLQLDPYPEAPAVLKRIKASGIRTAILSNGSVTMLAAGVASAKLREQLDFVISVDEIGTYKPSAAVYARAVERVGAASAKNICFLSSNPFDAHGAQTFGFRTVWVNRNNLVRDRLPGVPEFTVASLDDVPGLLGL